MSYQSSTGGLGSHSGFGYHGLSGAYPIGEANADVRAMQVELQRLGFLQSGNDRFGADGRWGPRTANALQSAAQYVGFTSAAYDPSDADRMSRGNVTVPDDLLDRLSAAQPAPPGTPGALSTQPGEEHPAVLPGPEEPSPLLTASTVETQPNWVPAAVVGGGVLLMGAYMWYQMRPKRVRANKKRRRQRRR